MKQRLLSFSDEGDARLKRLAKETNEGKKGAFSQTVEEALELLEKERRRKRAASFILDFARQNRKLGVGKFVRASIYRGHRFG